MSNDDLRSLSTEKLLIRYRRIRTGRGWEFAVGLRQLEACLQEARRRDAISDDAIIQVIDKEILWCEGNPDKAFHAAYRKGFINGLIQAKYLIAEICKAEQEATDE